MALLPEALEQERPTFVNGDGIFEQQDEDHEYLLCNNLATLLWLAQSGTLEFHVAPARETGRGHKNRHVDYARSLESLEASILNFPTRRIRHRPYIYSKGKAGASGTEHDCLRRTRKSPWLCELQEMCSSRRSQHPGNRTASSYRSVPSFDAARHVRTGRPAPAAPASVNHHDGVEHPQAHRQNLHGFQMNVRGRSTSSFRAAWPALRHPCL